jgi:hypothetical protein
MNRYDSWKLSEPKEAERVGLCMCCGEEIYDGDDIYATDDGWIHVDHFLDYCKEILRARRTTAER